MSQTIGVVLTTYNGEKFIEEQIESILGQTLPPDALVVVDDNSQDSTPEILERYSRTDKRIKIYRNEHKLGWIKNFEKGISLCDADYIALSDQDDIWVPYKLEKCVEKMVSHPGCGLCYHDAWLMYEDGTRLDLTLWQVNDPHYPLGRPEAQELLLGTMAPLSGFTIILENRLKELILPFPGYKCCGHDWWISAVSFFLFNPVCIETPLVCHRVHFGQAVGDPIIKLKKTKYALKKKILDRERIKKNIRREIYRAFHRKEVLARRREDERSRREEFASAIQKLMDLINAFDAENNTENKRNLLKKMLGYREKLLSGA